MSDNTINTTPTQPDVDDKTLTEKVDSLLGKPIYRNGKQMIRDIGSEEYFPVHPDIKSKIHYL